MREYVRYYHEDRTHLALLKGTPSTREAEKDPKTGCRVISMPRLGGLHHRYNLAKYSPAAFAELENLSAKPHGGDGSD